MAVIQIDLSKNTPIQSRGEFPVVPAGKYVVTITSFKEHVASTGNQGFLVKANVLWAEEIAAGPHDPDPDDLAGTPLIDAFYGKMILPALVNALKSIGHTEEVARDMINKGFDTELFVDEQVVWDVTVGTVSKGPNMGKPRNNVSRWSRVSDL